MTHLKTHVNRHRVVLIVSVDLWTVTPCVRVKRTISARLLVVVQSVWSVQNVLKTELVSIKNVQTHALEFAVSEQGVKL